MSELGDEAVDIVAEGADVAQRWILGGRRGGHEDVEAVQDGDSIQGAPAASGGS